MKNKIFNFIKQINTVFYIIIKYNPVSFPIYGQGEKTHQRTMRHKETDTKIDVIIKHYTNMI